MRYEVENNNNPKAGCLAIFVALLALAFIVLKLCGVIAWPWVWVLSPIWLYAALYVVILIVAVFLNIKEGWQWM